MRKTDKLGSKKRLIYFFFKRLQVSIINYLYNDIDNQYLFILSPPFSGSTLLSQIISSSKNVSCNNTIGLREGQHLPIVKDLLFTKDRWDPKKEVNWTYIHKIWKKYWIKSKSIFLEKSPPNICRAKHIENEFKPAKFICLVRNPYAQAEGSLRRYKHSAKEAAELSLSYLKYQKENIEELKEVYLIKYEVLTEKTHDVKDKLIDFLPNLSDININQKFNAHNLRKKKHLEITNLNKEKIQNLSEKDIKIMSSVFKKEESILKYFNYTII